MNWPATELRTTPASSSLTSPINIPGPSLRFSRAYSSNVPGTKPAFFWSSELRDARVGHLDPRCGSNPQRSHPMWYDHHLKTDNETGSSSSVATPPEGSGTSSTTVSECSSSSADSTLHPTLNSEEPLNRRESANTVLAEENSPYAHSAVSRRIT